MPFIVTPQLSSPVGDLLVLLSLVLVHMVPLLINRNLTVRLDLVDLQLVVVWKALEILCLKILDWILHLNKAFQLCLVKQRIPSLV